MVTMESKTEGPYRGDVQQLCSFDEPLHSGGKRIEEVPIW